MMKKILFIFSGVLIVPLFIILTAYTSDVQRRTRGMTSNTGSPGDGADCSQCHNGAVTVENDWIVTDIPASGYTPGETYTVTVTTDSLTAEKQGFAMVVEDDVDATVGSFIATDTNVTAAENGYISHVGGGVDTNSWSFEWTAPAAGVGNITFYSSIINNGRHNGIVNASMAYNEETTGITETRVLTDVVLYPNPATDQLRLEIPVGSNQNIAISVYSITGERVIQKEVLTSGGVWKETLNVSRLPAGVYSLKVIGNEMEYLKSFVVK